MILTLQELASVHGGGGLSTLWNIAKKPPSPGAPGSGPLTFMDMFDKPGKTFDNAKSFLGFGSSGAPGDFYSPATANPDGSINQGSFSPVDPSGPHAPISE